MTYTYNPQNIFAKILTGEIPCDRVMESEHSLAIRDLYPQAPVHILVIPKGPYVCYDHFALTATEAEVVDFTRMVGEVCRQQGLGENGFRLIANAGSDAAQDVPHLHVHVLAGRPLGRMLAKA